MESVDGARSLKAASEEIVEKLCDPCKYDGIEKEGIHFCTDCQEYFCQTCKDSHKKFKNSRNHTFLPSQAVTNAPADSKAVHFTVICSCEHNSEVNTYCENHDEVICQTCKVVKHRKCTTASVQDKSASYVVSKLNSVIQNTQNMRDEIKKFQQDRGNDIQTLNIMSEKCKKEIRSFRQELDTFISSLEEQILSELENVVRQEQTDIELHISSCSTPLNLLDVDSKLLEAAKNTVAKDEMFASDLKVSNHLKDFQSMLQDFQKEAKSHLFEFEANQKLVDVKKEIKTLGKIKINKMRCIEAEKSLLDMNVDSSRLVEIKLSEDNRTPWISGCVFMPDGQLVLCDYRNNNIKLLSSRFEIKEKFDLQSQPHDVSLVDSNRVIVTLPDIKTLLYVHVLPSLQTGRHFVLDRRCWGICVEDEIIYITCHDALGNGEVIMLDMSGNLLREIHPDVSDKYIKFQIPYYIAVSAPTKMIYISDWKTSMITCLTPEGNTAFQYKDTELKGPKGFYLDDKDNIIVCGVYSKNIQVIKSNCTKHCILFNAQEYTSQELCSIAYRHNDNILVIGCNGTNMLVLKLTK